MSSSKSRKKEPIIVALGDSFEKWNGHLLKTYGLPQEPQARNEVSESAFVNKSGVRSPLEVVAARQIRIGEEPPRGLSKVWAQESLPESQPSEQWKRSQAFVRVFTTIFAHQSKLPECERRELLKMVDELRPNEDLGVFPDELGSPEELYRRWQDHEIDVKFVHERRAKQIIRVLSYPMPPDVEEDLDEGGAPRGHWEDLTFIPE